MKTNHGLLNHYFQKHHYSEQRQKVLRGKLNKYFVFLYLNHYKVAPFYPQAQLWFIPDLQFDCVLMENKKRIVILSLKTCLRDRYRQVIIEAQQLKKLDTRFEYYLLTNDIVEAQRLNNKIQQGKVQGINQVIDVFHPNANHFMKQLISRTFVRFTEFKLIKN